MTWVGLTVVAVVGCGLVQRRPRFRPQTADCNEVVSG